MGVEGKMKIDIGPKQYFSFKATTFLGANPRTWLTILHRHRKDLGWQFIPKAIIITIVTFLNAPLIWWERLRFNKRIRATVVIEPVFIIGHQRSGTTYLHYLLGRDDQFAYCSVKESFMPWIYLSFGPFLKKVLGKALPEKRPMDDLRMGIDLPTEPEYSIGNMTASTMIPGYYFPNKMLSVFRKYVLFSDGKGKVKWQSAMKYFMQKLSLKYKGKRLIIKSPENLGRVKEIMEVFPDAKFIHIYRDPYKVYFSTERLYSITLPLVSMQHCNAEDIEDSILKYYREIYEKFLHDRSSIPVGHLAELRYEEFIGNEMSVLSEVYSTLGLPFPEDTRLRIQKEVNSYQDYKTNVYPRPEDRKKEVYREWKKIFEALGYPQ